MKISEMIAIMQAYERGEAVECRNSQGEWVGIKGWLGEYRIAPKKEMNLVELLRNFESTKVSDWLDITARAADRIESLELANASLSLEQRSTNELLAELKRRIP